MDICAIRIGKSLFTIAAWLLLVQLATVSALAQGQSRITSCQTISTPGRYVLANDLNCPNYGIDIKVHDVVLQLDGHRITGTSSEASGINVSIHRGEVQILGPGTVEGFGIGVNVTKCAGVVHVTGVASTGAALIGFNVRDSKVILQRNSASGSQIGFSLLTKTNSEVSGNMASGNSGEGFLIGTSANHIVHNTALSNGTNGIATVPGTMLNQILGNTAMGNSGFDLFEANETCRNLWAGNTFQTANKPCIE